MYVNPDLTRSKCETQKLLRDELKVRKEKGETDLIIRGNRIVKRRGTKNVGQSPSSPHTTASTRPSYQPMESDENNASS